jgi:hypothetical protein
VVAEAGLRYDGGEPVSIVKILQFRRQLTPGSGRERSPHLPGIGRRARELAST